MIPNEAIAAFGTPGDINSHGGAYGSGEQWVYVGSESEIGDEFYLYFEEGKLTSWQF